MTPTPIVKVLCCPYCGEPLSVEDHSSIGGPKQYWSCDTCGQEEYMVGVYK